MQSREPNLYIGAKVQFYSESLNHTFKIFGAVAQTTSRTILTSGLRHTAAKATILVSQGAANDSGRSNVASWGRTAGAAVCTGAVLASGFRDTKASATILVDKGATNHCGWSDVAWLGWGWRGRASTVLAGVLRNAFAIAAVFVTGGTANHCGWTAADWGCSWRGWGWGWGWGWCWE